MRLRSLTKHIREQNWFAVALDFAIVVLGVGMALAAGEWLSMRAQKADLAVARLAINEDMSDIYANALERLAFKECRIAQVQSIAAKLGSMDDAWTGISPRTEPSHRSGTLPNIMRAPFRGWPSGAFDTAKARGLLNQMDPEERQVLENAFMITPVAFDLQNTITSKQSQLKALSLELGLTPSDRLRYYDILAEIDTASALLETGSEYTIGYMETAFVNVASKTLAAFHSELREINAVAPVAYGDCYQLITLPNVDLTPIRAEQTQ